MLRSRLLLKVLASITLVMALLASAIYFVAVPLVERRAFEIELEAARTILDNVFEMASRMSGNLEERRGLTVGFFRAQMKNAVDMSAGYVEYIFERRDRGEIADAEARRLVFEGLRSFKYGDNGYIWVSDYNGVIVSHPDPAYHGRDASNITDDDGTSIVPMLVETARRLGPSFHTYSWTKLGSSKPSQKISYFKELKRFGLIVGSGFYVDDIDAEVEKRKTEAVSELRAALRSIRIARTGYAYVFDGKTNMVIHPNPNIEGAEFSDRPNPASGRPIAEDLKAVSDTGRPLTYLWDKPSDPSNYSYEKMSWVRHFRDLDWYIASSVYVEELRTSSVALGRRILTIAAGVMGLSGLIGYVIARRLLMPLQRLAETAASVRAGNLDVESGVVRKDEIGVLAAAFDSMIARVRENMAHLGQRVRERTAELENANARLQQAATEQQRSREALSEVEARQRLILDAIPFSIAYLDADTGVRFANRGWRELIGRIGDDERVMPLLDAIGGRAYSHISPHLARTRTGESTTFEYVYRNRTGREIITRNTLIPQMSRDGRVIGTFVLSRDVTDEKETERQLLEAQRLSAVGQLAGGLAHDFNNLLSIIIGNLSAAREKYRAVEGLSTYLVPAQRASRRGADITSRLLAFSRQHPLRSEPVDVSALVGEVAILLLRTLPLAIRIATNADRRPAWAFADPSQLEHALVNLALNARDAMPEGGTLLLTVEPRSIGAPLQLDEAVPPGDYVEIAVADTGNGFTPEAHARAFEPFFTTKTLGSGLGLSMVYGFVKQSKGYVHIASSTVGTRITLLLPATPEVVDTLDLRTPAASETDNLGHGALAIVAEDDNDVRRVMREQLNGFGFSVLEAVTGEEALRLIEQIESVGLLVSDIVMPGLGGIELARRVRAARSSVGIVLVTGFSVDRAPVDLAGIDVLLKPWDKQELAVAIARTLERANGEPMLVGP